MTVPLEDYLQENREACYMLLRRYLALGKAFLLKSELWDELQIYIAENPDVTLAESPLFKMIETAQEAAIESPWIYLAVRSYVARWKYLRIHVESIQLEPVTVSALLPVRSVAI